MSRAVRKHLTFANTCSALALFLVVAGGTAMAVGGLGRNVVKSKNIAPKAVATSDLADGAVTNPKLAPDSVTGDKIAAGAIGSAQLGAGSVGGAQIATNSVTGASIAPDSIDATKIPNAPSGSDAVDANTLNGFSASFFQLGDGADQVTQAPELEFGEESAVTIIASGTFTLSCAATPTLEFEDAPADGFVTDAWDPSHTTIADGSSHSFTLPTNGMKTIEIYGAGGDLIVVSSFVSGSTCTIVANSISNFTPILGHGNSATVKSSAHGLRPRAGAGR